ncbi:MAG: hypothetical protein ABSB35_07395 [Bryobacteraceae bacterium]|jgi:hypothetical protein
MRSSKKAVVPVKHPIARRRGLSVPNSMVFPHTLRDAIPGPELPGCGRSLILSSIDGSCSRSVFGRRMRLSFRVEEAGKLSGAFQVYADLNVEAAKALAATLQELVERVEHAPDGPPPLPFV